jgi:uncharacterized surface protein with fasciclin (FAS1) repeats
MSRKTTRRQLLQCTSTLALAAFSTTVTAGDHESSAPGDILEVAAAHGSLNTLVDAIETAGLTKELKGDGPFTLFAPTDEAFTTFRFRPLELLLKPNMFVQLDMLLLYHVVPGKILSADLEGTVIAATLEGDTMKIVVSVDGITVDGATVVTADIKAGNGVIHVIDDVLAPRSYQD